MRVRATVTLRDWKDGHREFFAGLGIALTDDTEMVLERFTLLWPG